MGKKAKTAKKGKKAKAKVTATSQSSLIVGSGKAGHTMATAGDVAEQLGIDPKRFRAWLRSGDGVGNDGKYTRYKIDLSSKEGKALVKNAQAHFAYASA